MDLDWIWIWTWAWQYLQPVQCSHDLYIQIPPARAVALIYIFKYPQPGQEDKIFNPSTGSAREEDMAIAMSWFSSITINMFVSKIVMRRQTLSCVELLIIPFKGLRFKKEIPPEYKGISNGWNHFHHQITHSSLTWRAPCWHSGRDVDIWSGIAMTIFEFFFTYYYYYIYSNQHYFTALGRVFKQYSSSP